MCATKEAKARSRTVCEAEIRHYYVNCPPRTHAPSVAVFKQRCSLIQWYRRQRRSERVENLLEFVKTETPPR